jgi:hypothetical protein
MRETAGSPAVPTIRRKNLSTRTFHRDLHALGVRSANAESVRTTRIARPARTRSVPYNQYAGFLLACRGVASGTNATSANVRCESVQTQIARSLLGWSQTGYLRRGSIHLMARTAHCSELPGRACLLCPGASDVAARSVRVLHCRGAGQHGQGGARAWRATAGRFGGDCRPRAHARDSTAGSALAWRGADDLWRRAAQVHHRGV